MYASTTPPATAPHIKSTAPPTVLTPSTIFDLYLTELGKWGSEVVTLALDAIPDDEQCPGWREGYQGMVVTRIDQEIELVEKKRSQYTEAITKILAVLSPQTKSESDVHPNTYSQRIQLSNRFICPTLDDDPGARKYLMDLQQNSRSDLRAALESFLQSVIWSHKFYVSRGSAAKEMCLRSKSILLDPTYVPYRNEKRESMEYKDDGRRADAVGNTSDAKSENHRSAGDSYRNILRTFRKYSQEAFNEATQWETMISYRQLTIDARMGWQLKDMIDVASEVEEEDASLGWVAGAWDIPKLKHIGRDFRTKYPSLTTKYEAGNENAESQRQNAIAATILDTVNKVVQDEAEPRGGLPPDESAILVDRIARGLSEAESTFSDGTMMLSAPDFVERSACSVIAHFGPEAWENIELVED